MSKLIITNTLSAAIRRMIDADNDYVVSDEVPAGFCIVNQGNGTAALMDTNGSCDMRKFTMIEVLA